MASNSIMIQTAGPAQSWNRRTVSMPRWMISSCSAQTTTKQITSSVEWLKHLAVLMEGEHAFIAHEQGDDGA